MGRWRTFVFCLGDCSFESEPSSTFADVCGEVTSCTAGCQEVGMCGTRGGSQGMYITFTSAKKVNKAEPTLALKRYQKSKTGEAVQKKFLKSNFGDLIWISICRFRIFASKITTTVTMITLRFTMDQNTEESKSSQITNSGEFKKCVPKII